MAEMMINVPVVIRGMKRTIEFKGSEFYCCRLEWTQIVGGQESFHVAETRALQIGDSDASV